MRNIHLLSTNDESNLAIIDNKILEYDQFVPYKSGMGIDEIHTQCKYLYITSNEETKFSNWCFEVHNGPSLAPDDTPRFIDENENIWWLREANCNDIAGCETTKKIILTNNPKLIKSGVQPIDSEFLNWLVGNPSTENIEVTKMLQVRWGVEWHDLPNQEYGRDPEGIYRKIYKLVIPKKDE